MLGATDDTFHPDSVHDTCGDDGCHGDLNRSAGGAPYDRQDASVHRLLELVPRLADFVPAGTVCCARDLVSDDALHRTSATMPWADVPGLVTEVA